MRLAGKRKERIETGIETIVLKERLSNSRSLIGGDRSKRASPSGLLAVVPKTTNLDRRSVHHVDVGVSMSCR